MGSDRKASYRDISDRPRNPREKALSDVEVGAGKMEGWKDGSPSIPDQNFKGRPDLKGCAPGFWCSRFGVRSFGVWGSVFHEKRENIRPHCSGRVLFVRRSPFFQASPSTRELSLAL